MTGATPYSCLTQRVRVSPLQLFILYYNAAMAAVVRAATYTADHLIGLCTARASPPSSAVVCDLLKANGIWRPCRLLGHRIVPRRGQRAGRRHFWSPRQPTQQPHLQSSLGTFPRNSLSFGLLNIRSVGGKIDDLLDVQRDHGIGVQCLVETWHDEDCSFFPTSSRRI